MDLEKGLISASFLVAVIVTLLDFPAGAVSVVVCLVTAILMGLWLHRLADNEADKKFIRHLFIAALLARVLFGIIAYSFDFWEYFAGDALAYGSWAQVLADHLWKGTDLTEFATRRFYSFQGTGWGMYWIIGFVYMFTGENPSAANCFFAVFGAATAPLTFLCSKKLFNNTKVATIASLLVAFSPGFINWSSFMMKDGLIMFILVLAFFSLIRLQEKFNFLYLISLLGCFLGIVALRFYIFPMLATACLGSLLIGYKSKNTVGSTLQRLAFILTLGIVLTYAGAIGSVQRDVEKYGTFESLNNARLDQSRAGSGYSEGVDVSTTEGAITFLPVGISYLILAPFPWQMTSIRSALTLPEMLVWWTLLPFGVLGIWYSIRYNLRKTMPILLFSLMLTIGYSIFQGNVGTAYRQRTQIQIFFFIFIGAGVTVYKERKENQKLISALKHQRNKKTIRLQA
jgi:Dolichyl-phosphate-mannose-protein mannosyltransferase